MIARWSLAAVVLAGSFVLAGGTACAATGAGVVIESPGSVREFCVEVPSEGATGLDVLAATGVRLDVQDFGADNLTICRIDDVGCAHPTDPCFCSCADVDEPCTFWGVYRVQDGAWVFSRIGLAQMRVRRGDTLGMRWTEQTEQGGGAPSVRARGVCARGMAVTLGASAATAPSVLPWVAIAALALVMIATSVTVRRRAGR